MLEGGAGLALAEAQVAKRQKSLPVRLRRSWTRHASVARAIGMPKAETGGDPPLDGQPPSMLCPVVRRTENNERIVVMVSPLRAEHDVMDVDKRRVSTS